jgi:colicin import membrane protein
MEDRRLQADEAGEKLSVFGISGFELFLIAAFALMIFGPDKLPQMAKTVGKAMREFKKAQESMEAMMRAEMYASDKPRPKSDEAAAAVAEAIVPDLGDDEDEEEEEEEEEEE